MEIIAIYRKNVHTLSLAQVVLVSTSNQHSGTILVKLLQNSIFMRCVLNSIKTEFHPIVRQGLQQAAVLML